MGSPDKVECIFTFLYVGKHTLSYSESARKTTETDVHSCIVKQEKNTMKFIKKDIQDENGLGI